MKNCSPKYSLCITVAKSRLLDQKIEISSVSRFGHIIIFGMQCGGNIFMLSSRKFSSHLFSAKQKDRHLVSFQAKAVSNVSQLLLISESFRPEYFGDEKNFFRAVVDSLTHISRLLWDLSVRPFSLGICRRRFPQVPRTEKPRVWTAVIFG